MKRLEPMSLKFHLKKIHCTTIKKKILNNRYLLKIKSYILRKSLTKEIPIFSNEKKKSK